MPPPSPPAILPVWLRFSRQPVVLAAIASLVAVLWSLSPATHGPGVTCDEGHYVAEGKRYVMAWRQEGWRAFTPANIDGTMQFRPGGLPPYPPFGVWVLGWTHWLFDPAPDQLEVVAIVAARLAPAAAFGLIVLLVGLFVQHLEGPWAGTAAALSLALMPRMFAHAHLAALDTLVALTSLVSLLALAEAVRRGGRPWHMAAAGVLWGLALLTKIHGVLIVPPVVLWLAWQLRRRALIAIPIWGLTGVATLLAGWPWLWPSPIARLAAFLASGTNRASLHTFYLDRVWQDTDVPWHYPWAIFLATVPLGLLLGGGYGLWSAGRDRGASPAYALLGGSLLFTLLFFGLPGVPVYDSERLFLLAYPLWAILVGRGVKRLLELPRLARLSTASRALALGGFLALQAIGLVQMHPFQLSYYNALVGGLWGAERLGFEVTYWGDTVQGALLAEAAQRSPAGPLLFAPDLAPFQVPAVQISSLALMESETRLIGFTSPDPDRANCHFALIYHRRADLMPLDKIMNDGQVVAETRRQGVWLARLYQLPVDYKP